MPTERNDPSIGESEAPQARTLHTAEILYPGGGAELLRDVGVVVDTATGEIVDVAPINRFAGGDLRRVDHQLLLPGVVNCHTHLTDVGIDHPVPGGEGLIQWVGELLHVRGAQSKPGEDGSDPAMNVRSALAGMQSLGTVAIGEVANNHATYPAILASGMHCRFIHELLAFLPERAEEAMECARIEAGAREWNSRMAPSVGIHAPYSVSIPLAQAIVSENRRHRQPTFIHLAEDPDERLLHTDGGGRWPGMLRSIGVWNNDWVPSGKSPIELYADLGLLDESFVAVHLTDARPDELLLLGRSGARAVLSPTSNLHITGRLPDLESIVAAGIPFGFGTDGRGSNRSIDVLDEARLVAERWPDLAPGMILAGLVATGAAILGLADVGAVEPGRHPGLIALEIAGSVRTVAEIERALLFDATARRRVA